MTPLAVICCYLVVLLALGLLSNRFFRGTSHDYFVASQSIGPFLLLMSVFGTTMTAFALVGSTGKSFERGIGVYGLMASSSGLIHAAVFFLIAIKLWTHGKRHGFVTQIQFFRARFESDALGYLLFPVLVGLVIPYLLIGVIGAGKTILPVTAGSFVELFPHPRFAGGIPPWLTGLVVCGVVMTYVFAGGSRGTAWANAFQTIVFMIMAVVAFLFIANSLGGLANATQITMQVTPDGNVVQTHRFDKNARRLVKNAPPKIMGTVRSQTGSPPSPHQPHLTRTVTVVELKTKNPKTGQVGSFTREYGVPPWMFATYMFIPLSVGMFPHLFQHWLTARSARTFRLTVMAHPLCIMVVWVPCVLIGIWASGILPNLPSDKVAAVLGIMVRTLVDSPLLTGFLTAGILAAIMSSLDSQFLCLGTIFTNDIVLHRAGPDRFSDKQVIWIARGFVIGIVAVTYILSLISPQNIFDLAIWCFSGFAALFPLVFAALYWRRATKAGAFSSIIATMAVWFWCFRASGYGGEYTLVGGVMPVAACFIAGAVAMVVVSLVTSPPSKATIDKFFPPSKPV